MTIVNATDVGLDLDRLAEPRRPPDVFILVGIADAWSMFEHARAFLGLAPCPECHGRPLGRLEYCLACDRAGIDLLGLELPGLAVDSHPDQAWLEEREKRRARGGTRWRGRGQAKGA